MTKKLIQYENLTPAGKEIYNMLVKVWDNDDFIIGVLSYINEEPDRIDFIEFLKKHPELNDEDITVYALGRSLGIDNPLQ